jgi:hypothetical protein
MSTTMDVDALAEAVATARALEQDQVQNRQTALDTLSENLRAKQAIQRIEEETERKLADLKHRLELAEQELAEQAAAKFGIPHTPWTNATPEANLTGGTVVATSHRAGTAPAGEPVTIIIIPLAAGSTTMSGQPMTQGEGGSMSTGTVEELMTQTGESVSITRPAAPPTTEPIARTAALGL